jgi:tetratricopeptide (TPR) repeat protein/predicted Ser/Thr protein kinase
MSADEVEDSSLDAALRGAQPSSDSLARDHVRSRLAATLFSDPPAPVHVDRFVLLERLGQGGMGVVYSAYDPKLDRRVALKLLHARASRDTDVAYRRIVREARALARLSHPNVVPVHDVGVIDGKVFLVMEFVAGKTLRAWLAQAGRAWRDVLGVYLQAGRGLAAAHAVGIVHRDFKPDNALIGDDGRVRVADFGLALGRSDEETAPHDSPGARPPAPEPLGASATASRVLAGTPAYMAPEQFAGADVGPAADQFGFCVALYEGLYGQKPFAGSSAPELLEAVAAGRVREPPRDRRVPAWVHHALCRGLAPAPEARHRSMSALLAELSRDPGQTRRRWLAAIAIASLAAATTYALARGSDSAAETCQGGPAALAQVWNPDRRDRVEGALRATGRAYADVIAPRLVAGLDRYGAAWSAMRHDACVSHQRGEQSGDMLDRRMRCLDGRLTALDRALVVIEEVDTQSLGHSLQVVENLPSIRYCADGGALAAEVPPPADAALARSVEALRARLSQVSALESAGRFPDALAMARIIGGEAEALGYDPALAEALLAEGRSAMMIRPAAFADAIAPLRRAAELALVHRMWPLAVEALARRFYVQSLMSEDLAEVHALIPVAEALSRHVADRGFARTLLLNNIGTVHMAQGDRERARHYFEQALGELERAPEVALELTCVRRNLAMVTPDVAQRARLMQTELERLERELGESHPWALDLRLAYAHYTSDPERARALLAPACERYERFHREHVGSWISCLYYLGFLGAELGEREQAARILDRAAALGGAESVTEDLAWHDLGRGYSLVLRGEHAAALAALQAVRDRFAARTAEWWLGQRVAHARLGIGLVEQALGRHGAAIRELETAAATFEELRRRNQDVEHEQRLALAQVALAQSLWAQGPAGRARARELLARAHGWYAEVGGGYARRARELATLREAWARSP